MRVLRLPFPPCFSHDFSILFFSLEKAEKKTVSLPPRSFLLRPNPEEEGGREIPFRIYFPSFYFDFFWGGINVRACVCDVLNI